MLLLDSLPIRALKGHKPLADHARACAFAALAAAVLTACGGSDSPEPASEEPPVSGTPPGPTPPPPSGGNHAPTIGGTPPASVMQDAQYSFTPIASDADGDSLIFSISNKPDWATFNTGTGWLRGTPGSGHVRTYNNVMISVSDGEASASLGPFSISVVATATGSVTLSWTAPTTRSDGSALTNLAGFKIYWGPAEGDYPNSATVENPGITVYVVEPLTPATWHFVVTALDLQGLESQASNDASKTVL